jgi:hypothetical protein
MMGVIAGMKKAPCRAHLFGAAFSAHSLGRLLDRTGFQSDPVKAMHAAHDALLALPVEEGSRLFDLPGFPLPAGRVHFSRRYAASARIAPHWRLPVRGSAPTKPTMTR